MYKTMIFHYISSNHKRQKEIYYFWIFFIGIKDIIILFSHMMQGLRTLLNIHNIYKYINYIYVLLFVHLQ